MERIEREAALLQAISNDNAAEVSSAMRMAEGSEDVVAAQELLELRVKPTFNDPKNPKAFFHSVASFGLDFALDENITQLAQRNEKMEAFKVLDALEKRLTGTSSAYVPRDLAAEAQLLTAVNKDDGAAVTKVLSANGEALLKLTVEETFKDATGSAFYHSVAAYGLAFELGDTIYTLAARNGKTQAAESLESFGRPADVKVEVLVTNAVNGEELCRVSASSSWTMLQLAHDVVSQVPTQGCRIFLLGGAALTTGTTLADVMKEREGDSDILELSSLVRSNVHGVYTATVTRDDHDDDLGLGGGRLHGGRLGRLGGRLGRRAPPQNLQLELKEDGTAIFEYSAHPVDRGHCAPPSGGRLIKGTGHWKFEASNLELSITAGDAGHFIRCIPRLDGPLSPFVLILTLVKEDQLDVVDMNPLDSTAAPSPRGRYFHRFCPTGTAFLKKGEGEETASLVRLRT